MKRDPQILEPEVAIGADSNYDCAVCLPATFGFQKHLEAQRLFKFSPGIGSQGPAPMAFAGFNPRVSDTNRVVLYDVITTDRDAYIAHAHNRAPDGQPYVRIQGGERHYHTHARIVHAATRDTEYEGKPFEEVAVCTELFLCATLRQTAALGASLADGSAVCPRLHFWKVIQRAAPRVLVTLGGAVFDYVSTFASWDGSVYKLNMPTAAVIIAIPHPNSRKRLTNTELPQVADACRQVLLDKPPTALDFRSSTSSSPSPQQNQLERVFEWSDRYGWQVEHRPADLVWLEVNGNRLITYLLNKNGELRYKMVLNGAQLRQAITWRNWPANRYINPVTKTVDHHRTEKFLSQWAPYVIKVD